MMAKFIVHPPSNGYSQSFGVTARRFYLSDMETLLAFVATFVMAQQEARQLMRWNMTMLHKSPWYVAIEKEGRR